MEGNFFRIFAGVVSVFLSPRNPGSRALGKGVDCGGSVAFFHRDDDSGAYYIPKKSDQMAICRLQDPFDFLRSSFGPVASPLGTAVVAIVLRRKNRFQMQINRAARRGCPWLFLWVIFQWNRSSFWLLLW